MNEEDENMSCEVVTFLSMNGKGAEAIAFYSRHLRATLLYQVTYEELKRMDPAATVEAGKEQWISHSVLQVGAHQIMLAEETMDPESEYVVGNNTSLCIQSADKREIENMYGSLTQDPRTKVIRPIGPVVFSEAYGIVQDPYGVFIQLTYDKRLAESGKA
jgi:PhnB protein